MVNSKILKDTTGDLIEEESLLDKKCRILQVLILYDAVTERAFRKGYKSPDDFIIRPTKLSDLPKVPDDFMTCQAIVQTCYKKFNPEGEPQISFREARKIVYCYKAIEDYLMSLKLDPGRSHSSCRVCKILCLFAINMAANRLKIIQMLLNIGS